VSQKKSVMVDLDMEVDPTADQDLTLAQILVPGLMEVQDSTVEMEFFEILTLMQNSFLRSSKSNQSLGMQLISENKKNCFFMLRCLRALEIII